jgi:hypothetical protein
MRRSITNPPEYLSMKENWFNFIFACSFVSAKDNPAGSGGLLNYQTSLCVRYECKILQFVWANS